MNIQHDTYRVTWSPEDGEHVGLCTEFPSLSWLAKTPDAALKGIQKVVGKVVSVHRNLALMAAEQGISLNRLAGAKLAA